MSRTIKTDVAIMGSGLAGLSAAYRLLKTTDLKVAIFEKRPYQGGVVSNCPMAFMSLPDTPEHMASALRVMGEFTNYAGDLGLARTIFHYSSLLPDIVLGELGIEVEDMIVNDPATFGQKRAYGSGFPNGMDVGDYYFIKGRGQGHAAALVCLGYRRIIESLGGQFYFNTPIQKIIREGDRVTGAVACDKTGERVDIRCKTLLVASGGISDNPQMMKEELGLTRTDDDCSGDGDVIFIHFKNSKETGDGQRAVWEIGGAKGGISVSGHSVVPGPGIVGNIAWMPRNLLRIVQEQPYLWVDANGKRFMNEEMSDQHMAVGAGLYNNPGHCGYIIWDEDTTKRWAKRGVEDDYVYFIFRGKKIEFIREQIDMVKAQGNRHVYHGDTIHDLCEYMGIDEKGLRETLADYNSYCENGVDLEFGKNPRFLRPVREESGQVYAMRIHLGGYDTIGGITVNRYCQVLDTKKKVIPGLYSAGDMIAGSLYGNPPVNASSSFTASCSSGLAAADYMAKEIKGE